MVKIMQTYFFIYQRVILFLFQLSLEIMLHYVGNSWSTSKGYVIRMIAGGLVSQLWLYCHICQIAGNRYLVTVIKQTMFLWTLHWRHNDHDDVSNHQPYDCLLNRLFGRRSKKTWKLRVTGLCVGNSPGPVNSPHKGPVTRKMFPFDDVIMKSGGRKLVGFFVNSRCALSLR